MGIPDAEHGKAWTSLSASLRDGDHGDAGFHKTPRQQQIGASLKAIPHTRVFPVQVQRLVHCARSDHSKRSFLEFVQRMQPLESLGIATRLVKLGEQGLALVEAVGGHVGG